MTVRVNARRATIAGCLAALAMVVSSTQPALADTSIIERSTMVEWLDQGSIDGVNGNMHVARVQFWVPAGERTVSYLYGEMYDYTCPPAFVPDGLGVGAIAQLDATCIIEDNLIFQSGDLDLNVNGKLHSARLVGDLDYIHTLVVAHPSSFAMDLRWDAPGDKTVVRQVLAPRPPRVIGVTTTREALSVTGTIGSQVIGSGVQASSGVVQRFKTIYRN